ncbi:MAG: hypothetical protein EPO22_07775 [Dehalococcoidia bacterium]|nr:MAG: hypothetical protein EPO22_07775 [Dehalococcoidia bacterium]
MTKNDVARPVSVIDLNLLPREQRPPDVAPIAIALGVAVVLGIVVLVPLGVRAHDARQRADDAEASVAATDGEMRALESALMRQRGMRSELDATEAQAAALKSEQAHLQGGARPLADDLAQVWGWGYAPIGTSITLVAGTDTGFRVDGTAPDPLVAIAFADTLRQRGGFPTARMASFKPAGNGGGEFSIEVVR